MSWGPPREVVPGGLTDVTCPSASLCLALTGDSYILMSRDPGGGADGWKLVNFAPGLTPTPNDPSISGVSCPSARLCVATDGTSVLLTTDPAAGGAAWMGETVDSVPMSGISCPSVSLCVAVDIDQNVVTSTDPTGGAGTWTSAKVDHAVGPECGKYEPGDGCILGFDDIACPTVSLCVAIDGEDNVVTSTDPTGGASAWNVGNPDPDDEEDVFGLNGVSCPSASFCMTVGEGGVVLSSREPADGASSWSSSEAADLGWASCPFVTFCVGGTYDQNPVGVVSDDPTGGAAAWRTVIDRQGGINAAACPTRSFCVAVDSEGGVLTGSPTPSRTEVRRLLNKLTLRLSRDGRGALRRAGGEERLGAVGSFSASEGPTVTVTRRG
jgi:hypothetical protein